MDFFISNAHAQGAPQADPFGFLLPMLVIFAAFYFLLIRPQQKEQQKQHHNVTETISLISDPTCALSLGANASRSR